MRSVSVHLHQHSDGHYVLSVQAWECGDVVRELLHEESHPLPGVSMSDALAVASQMAVETVRDLEPSPSLWGASGAFRTG